MFRFLFFLLPLQALALLPVDVSYIIADLKYHPTRGAQICEIQHGINSSFRGSTMLHEKKDQISTKIAGCLSSYYENSWTIPRNISDHVLQDLLVSHPKWTSCKDVKELLKCIKGLFPPADPFSLKSYHGFVFIGPELQEERKSLQTLYPGVVIIDEAFSGLVNNKLKMTKLLMDDPYTRQHKPAWGLYHRDDAEQILNDIQSDLLVIKPISQTRGNGVIILRREELKKTLELFGKQKKPFKDSAYDYWRTNTTAEFIVEEFIESEPVSVSHLEGKFYSPTMRLVFLLFYDHHEIKIQCMGGYYNLPSVSLSEPGTLNEIHKSACTKPYYEKVDPAVMQVAEEQIKKVLTIIYQKLLILP